jgi:hypothetical protein
MTHDRVDAVDLTELDPDSTPGAEDRFVEAVMTRVAASAPADVARANPFDPFWGAWSLARPVLIAASIVIVIASVVLARSAAASDPGPQTVAESVGVPPEFLRLMAAGGSAQSEGRR